MFTVTRYFRNAARESAHLVLASTVLFCALPARGQSVIQQLKDQMKKAKEQMKQAGHPQQTLPNSPAGTGAANSKSTVEGPDSSGPIHPPRGTEIREMPMAPLTDGAKFFVSPHGVHVATFENSGSRAVIYYDGAPGPKFDEIIGGDNNSPGQAQIAFSPDGKRYAYCGRLGNEMVVMVDGKEVLRTTESILGAFNGKSCSLGFTANSQHVFLETGVVHSTMKGGSLRRFVFDEKAGPPSTYGTNQNGEPGGIHPSFSPDGNHYAYVAVNPADEQNWGLVVDGKTAQYRGGAPQWTADSQHLYTVLRTSVPGRGQVAEAMLDGKPFLRADDVRLYVAPAGNMVVAHVFAGSNSPRPIQFLTVDGKKVPNSEAIHQHGESLDMITISPDGKHFAARFSEANSHQFVLVDGKRGTEYQSVDHIAFTADSSNVVYTAFANGKPYVIIGDQESQPCLAPLSAPVIDPRGGLMIAPTGPHAGTICGLTAGAPTLYMDGKTLPIPDAGVSANDLRFSADGQHYAYIAGFRDMARRIVLDGRLLAECNMGAPTTTIGDQYVFSPDSNHIAVRSVPPSPTSQYASGLCLDGKYVSSLATPAFYRLTFSADSKHIAWAQPVPGQHAFRVFLDGKAVAEAEEAIDPNSHEAWWEMTPDGTLSFLAQDSANLKRITITPSADTNLATLTGGRSEMAKKAN